MKPTRLYIKQHSITGMKYLGKSIKEDIEKYTGSGKRWLRHVNKHGKEHIKTIWVSDWFYDEDIIQEYALNLSQLHNITEQEEFANLKPENGLDGGVMPDYALRQGIEKRKGRTKETHDYIRIAAEKKKQQTLETCEWQRARSKRLKDKNSSLQEEEKKKIYGHPCQEELKKKFSIERTGQTKETNQRVRKMSETKILKNSFLTPEQVKEKHTTTGGMAWYHSDEDKKQIFVNPENVPIGYTKGRKNYNPMSWYHSDVERKQICCSVDKVPEGFVKGRKFYNENKKD